MSQRLEPPSSELAALLARLPRAASPSLEAKQRVLQRIAGSMFAAAAAGTIGGAASTAKLVALVAAASGLGLGAGIMADRLWLAPAPTVIVRTERVEVPVPTPAPLPEPVPTPAPSPPQTLPPQPAPRPAPTRMTAAPAGTEERRLIEAMRTALLKREPRAALDAAARHRRSFAGGQLAEERDSLEVQALAQDGRLEEARAAAVKFATRYPGSIFGPAVEAAVSP